MNVGFNPHGTVLPTGIAGSYYLHNITITKGVAPYNIIIQGRVPGLEISISSIEGADQIVIKGTPKQMGTYSFTITMMDSKEDTYNRSYTIKISLANFVKYLEDLRKAAIYLRKYHSQYEYSCLINDFYRFQYYCYPITDHDTLDLIESTIIGLQDIIENPYVDIDDALDIMIATLPSTIRFIQSL